MAPQERITSVLVKRPSEYLAYQRVMDQYQVQCYVYATYFKVKENKVSMCRWGCSGVVFVKKWLEVLLCPLVEIFFGCIIVASTSVADDTLMVYCGGWMFTSDLVMYLHASCIIWNAWSNESTFLKVGLYLSIVNAAK